ncbi:MAG: stalk domain-containing protein [Cellulosilyticaceae bacterium]
MLKNKSKRVFTMGLSAVLGSCMLITAVGAATGTKKIDAYYNNIKVVYNGQQKYLSQEPFMYNNTVYVPVRGVSEISGAEVKWGNNTVTIDQNDVSTGGGTGSSSELAEKNFQISKLTAENAELKKKVEQYEGTGGTTGTGVTDQALATTEKFLNDQYGDNYDVSWDIKLVRKGSKLVLTTEYDSKFDSKYYGKIRESQLKSFLEDLCEEVQTRHKDIEISGSLVDVNRNFTAYTFGMSKTGRYSFDREKEPTSLSSFGERLKSRYGTISGLKTNDSTPVDFSLSVASVRLRETNDSIKYDIYVTISGSDRDKWNKLSYDSKTRVESYLETIVDDIEDEYSVYEVTGDLRDSTTEKSIFCIDDRNMIYSTITP